MQTPGGDPPPPDEDDTRPAAVQEEDILPEDPLEREKEILSQQIEVEQKLLDDAIRNKARETLNLLSIDAGSELSQEQSAEELNRAVMDIVQSRLDLQELMEDLIKDATRNARFVQADARLDFLKQVLYRRAAKYQTDEARARLAAARVNRKVQLQFREISGANSAITELVSEFLGAELDAAMRHALAPLPTTFAESDASEVFEPEGDAEEQLAAAAALTRLVRDTASYTQQRQLVEQIGLETEELSQPAIDLLEKTGLDDKEKKGLTQEEIGAVKQKLLRSEGFQERFHRVSLVLTRIFRAMDNASKSRARDAQVEALESLAGATSGAAAGKKKMRVIRDDNSTDEDEPLSQRRASAAAAAKKPTPAPAPPNPAGKKGKSPAPAGIFIPKKPKQNQQSRLAAQAEADALAAFVEKQKRRGAPNMARTGEACQTHARDWGWFNQPTPQGEYERPTPESIKAEFGSDTVTYELWKTWMLEVVVPDFDAGTMDEVMKEDLVYGQCDVPHLRQASGGFQRDANGSIKFRRYPDDHPRHAGKPRPRRHMLETSGEGVGKSLTFGKDYRKAASGTHSELIPRAEETVVPLIVNGQLVESAKDGTPLTGKLKLDYMHKLKYSSDPSTGKVIKWDGNRQHYKSRFYRHMRSAVVVIIPTRLNQYHHEWQYARALRNPLVEAASVTPVVPDFGYKSTRTRSEDTDLEQYMQWSQRATDTQNNKAKTAVYRKSEMQIVVLGATVTKHLASALVLHTASRPFKYALFNDETWLKLWAPLVVNSSDASQQSEADIAAAVERVAKAAAASIEENIKNGKYFVLAPGKSEGESGSWFEVAHSDEPWLTPTCMQKDDEHKRMREAHARTGYASRTPVAFPILPVRSYGGAIPRTLAEEEHEDGTDVLHYIQTSVTDIRQFGKQGINLLGPKETSESYEAWPEKLTPPGDQPVPASRIPNTWPMVGGKTSEFPLEDRHKIINEANRRRLASWSPSIPQVFEEYPSRRFSPKSRLDRRQRLHKLIMDSFVTNSDALVLLSDPSSRVQRQNQALNVKQLAASKRWSNETRGPSMYIRQHGNRFVEATHPRPILPTVVLYTKDANDRRVRLAARSRRAGPDPSVSGPSNRVFRPGITVRNAGTRGRQSSRYLSKSAKSGDGDGGPDDEAEDPQAVDGANSGIDPDWMMPYNVETMVQKFLFEHYDTFQYQEVSTHPQAIEGATFKEAREAKIDGTDAGVPVQLHNLHPDTSPIGVSPIHNIMKPLPEKLAEGGLHAVVRFDTHPAAGYGGLDTEMGVPMNWDLHEIAASGARDLRLIHGNSNEDDGSGNATSRASRVGPPAWFEREVEILKAAKKQADEANDPGILQVPWELPDRQPQHTEALPKFLPPERLMGSRHLTRSVYEAYMKLGIPSDPNGYTAPVLQAPQPDEDTPMVDAEKEGDGVIPIPAEKPDRQVDPNVRMAATERARKSQEINDAATQRRLKSRQEKLRRMGFTIDAWELKKQTEAARAKEQEPAEQERRKMAEDAPLAELQRQPKRANRFSGVDVLAALRSASIHCNALSPVAWKIAESVTDGNCLYDSVRIVLTSANMSGFLPMNGQGRPEDVNHQIRQWAVTWLASDAPAAKAMFEDAPFKAQLFEQGNFDQAKPSTYPALYESMLAMRRVFGDISSDTPIELLKQYYLHLASLDRMYANFLELTAISFVFGRRVCVYRAVHPSIPGLKVESPPEAPAGGPEVAINLWWGGEGNMHFRPIVQPAGFSVQSMDTSGSPTGSSELMKSDLKGDDTGLHLLPEDIMDTAAKRGREEEEDGQEEDGQEEGDQEEDLDLDDDEVVEDGSEFEKELEQEVADLNPAEQIQAKRRAATERRLLGLTAYVTLFDHDDLKTAKAEIDKQWDDLMSNNQAYWKYADMFVLDESIPAHPRLIKNRYGTYDYSQKRYTRIEDASSLQLSGPDAVGGSERTGDGMPAGSSRAFCTRPRERRRDSWRRDRVEFGRPMVHDHVRYDFGQKKLVSVKGDSVLPHIAFTKRVERWTAAYADLERSGSIYLTTQAEESQLAADIAIMSTVPARLTWFENLGKQLEDEDMTFRSYYPFGAWCDLEQLFYVREIMLEFKMLVEAIDRYRATASAIRSNPSKYETLDAANFPRVYHVFRNEDRDNVPTREEMAIRLPILGKQIYRAFVIFFNPKWKDKREPLNADYWKVDGEIEEFGNLDEETEDEIQTKAGTNASMYDIVKPENCLAPATFDVCLAAIDFAFRDQVNSINQSVNGHLLGIKQAAERRRDNFIKQTTAPLFPEGSDPSMEKMLAKLYSIRKAPNGRVLRSEERPLAVLRKLHKDAQQATKNFAAAIPTLSATANLSRDRPDIEYLIELVESFNRKREKEKNSRYSKEMPFAEYKRHRNTLSRLLSDNLLKQHLPRNPSATWPFVVPRDRIERNKRFVVFRSVVDMLNPEPQKLIRYRLLLGLCSKPHQLLRVDMDKEVKADLIAAGLVTEGDNEEISDATLSNLGPTNRSLVDTLVMLNADKERAAKAVTKAHLALEYKYDLSPETADRQAEARKLLKRALDDAEKALERKKGLYDATSSLFDIVKGFYHSTLKFRQLEDSFIEGNNFVAKEDNTPNGAFPGSKSFCRELRARVDRTSWTLWPHDSLHLADSYRSYEEPEEGGEWDNLNDVVFEVGPTYLDPNADPEEFEAKLPHIVGNGSFYDTDGRFYMGRLNAPPAFVTNEIPLPPEWEIARSAGNFYDSEARQDDGVLIGTEIYGPKGEYARYVLDLLYGTPTDSGLIELVEEVDGAERRDPNSLDPPDPSTYLNVPRLDERVKSRDLPWSTLTSRRSVPLPYWAWYDLIRDGSRGYYGYNPVNNSGGWPTKKRAEPKPASSGASASSMKIKDVVPKDLQGAERIGFDPIYQTFDQADDLDYSDDDEPWLDLRIPGIVLDDDFVPTVAEKLERWTKDYTDDEQFESFYLRTLYRHWGLLASSLRDGDVTMGVEDPIPWPLKRTDTGKAPPMLADPCVKKDASGQILHIVDLEADPLKMPEGWTVGFPETPSNTIPVPIERDTKRKKGATEEQNEASAYVDPEFYPAMHTFEFRARLYYNHRKHEGAQLRMAAGNENLLFQCRFLWDDIDRFGIPYLFVLENPIVQVTYGPKLKEQQWNALYKQRDRDGYYAAYRKVASEPVDPGQSVPPIYDPTQDDRPPAGTVTDPPPDNRFELYSDPGSLDSDDERGAQAQGKKDKSDLYSDYGGSDDESGNNPGKRPKVAKPVIARAFSFSDVFNPERIQQRIALREMEQAEGVDSIIRGVDDYLDAGGFQDDLSPDDQEKIRDAFDNMPNYPAPQP